MATHLIRWLLTDGTKITSTHELLKATSTHLRHMNVPVDRAFVGSVIAHPQVSGMSSIYEHPTGISRDLLVPNEIVARGIHQSDSPIGHTLHTNQALRAQLELGQTFQMQDLVELRESGYTDYVAFPLLLHAEPTGAIAFGTMRGGGFTDQHIAILEQLTPALSLVIAQKTSERIQLELLQNYLGRDAGKKVYEGKVHRGESQNIRAAILLTDLRGYTLANHRHPPEVILSLLNDVFDIAVRAIHTCEGQVLKFLGDGLLAIFADAPANIACDRAFVASTKIHHALYELNLRRKRQQRPALKLGIGLHYGDVLYGNVGASNRQDFTVIGSAVNVAARIENLSSRLEEPTLISAQFAEFVAHKLQSRGKHAVRGIPEPLEVFAIPRQ